VPGRPRRTNCAVAVACGLALALAGGGCAFGPTVLEKTHGRYNESVRLVEEEQLLRNLVHLRYNETPLDLNVSSIASQYELAGSAEARPFFLAPNPNGSIFRTFTSVLPDVSVDGSNRPTITLIPADNGAAVQQFLTPIPPETLVFLHQTSWPVSTIMRLWVERINGVPNAVTESGPQTPHPPDFARFLRLAELLQWMQDNQMAWVHAVDRVTEVGGPLPAGAVDAAAAVEAVKEGLEYRPGNDGASWLLVRKERRLVIDVTPEALGSPEVAELTWILNLQPGLTHYDDVVASGIVPDPLRHRTPPSTEVKLMPRSTAQVYFFLSKAVEVPPEHLVCGLVQPPPTPRAGSSTTGR
jgi:hypothetical protein